MTAPDRTTWTVTEDAHHCPTIWDERNRVVATLDVDILVGPEYTDLLWQVLTRVLAPDEATIERLAREVTARIAYDEDVVVTLTNREIRAVLAALAAAPGPTGDEAVSA